MQSSQPTDRPSPLPPPASPDGQTTELRTFLVADIRDFTAFASRFGDAEAARLATAFATITREGIAARGGELIDFRGDQSLAGFASARQALQAAVDLQQRFAQQVEDDPSLPLRVGIGLAAGEVMPTETGYRGRAVHLAEQLCSQARPGEILASDDLLHLAGTTRGLTYVELRPIEIASFDEPVRISRVLSEEAVEAAGKAGANVLRVQLFGGFRVATGEREIPESEWRLKKAATLVKLLALEPAHRMHREQALDLLWPALDLSAAANNLHHVLHVARRVLQPGATRLGALKLQNDQITLWPSEEIWTDVAAFEEAASAARQSQDPERYRAAADLYTGDLLPEDLYEDWAADRRQGLRNTYLGLLVEAAGLEEQRGAVRRAIDLLLRAVSHDQTLEEAHAGLMRLYARAGQRQQALRQYEQLQQALKSELDVPPDDATRQLYETILAGDLSGGVPRSAGAPTPHVTPRHNLPTSLTSFVGRERERAWAAELLHSARLLTLMGPGGSGKTRLAIAVAGDLLSDFPDGVRFVELASIADPSLLPQAVGAVADVREQGGRSLLDVIVDALGSRRMLLVLDNCEHLIDACAEIAEILLGACPDLQILATSREALRVPGEVTWVVPTLSQPDADRRLEPDELMAFEAVRLFVERAAARQPSFALTPANAPAVASICRQLDGIPLAIELAAARIGVLSPEQIAARLENALGLLTGGKRTSLPHQQTLRTTIDWSYQSLDDREQVLFDRLSVFAGGWTLEAAEAACTGGKVQTMDVLDLLSRLVDKSLITTEGSADAGTRYRILGPIRQYGEERLEEIGEAQTVRQRHAILFLSLAEQAENELKGPRQVAWLDRLEAELDNIRAALGWALDERGENRVQRTELGLRLAGALWQFWHSRGHVSEGRAWLLRGLAHCDGVPGAVRAKALSHAGWHALIQAAYDESDEMLGLSLKLYEELGDKRGMANVLERLGDLAVYQGTHEVARERHERSLALRRELKDRWGISKSLSSLALFSLLANDRAQLTKTLDEALALSREIGDQRGIAVTAHNIGMAAVELGEYDRAMAPLTESLVLFYEQRNKHDCSYCLEAMARVAGVQRKPLRAARLFGAAASMREDVSSVISPDRVEWVERAVADSRTAGDEEQWAAAWEQGRRMTLDEAVTYALGDQEPALPAVSVAGAERPSVLSRREQEIAALIAQGLTNRQIAARLVISERTVDTHVSKILGKLDLASRAQVAAWITEQGLPSGQ